MFPSSLALLGLSVCMFIPLGQAANSTIYNPIFPGFYPDPSCIFVAEHNNTFFCASSSFNAFPGIPIHTSQDLQNWKLIGHALNRKEQLPRLAETNRSTSGIWAPTLRFHHGTFWVVTTLVDDHLPQTDSSRWDNIIFHSKNPADPASWSIATHFKLEGYDPDLFWDDVTNKTYLTAAHAWQVGPYIVQAEIDLGSGALLTEWQTIWNGTGGLAPEGPHIYLKDGYYYLLAAEGGTGLEHMVTMARSRSVSGPFESNPSNPVLTNANTSSLFQTVGHADVFPDPNGNYWAVALSTRSGPEYVHYPMGRETVLTAVSWPEGQFPVFTPIAGKISAWSRRFLPSSSPSDSDLDDDDDDDDDDDLQNFETNPESINSMTEELVTFFSANSSSGGHHHLMMMMMPSHFLHWRFPNPSHFAVSPPEKPGTLRLSPSDLNLTGLNGNYAGPDGQSFVSRRQQHTLFTFSVELEFDPLRVLQQQAETEAEAGVTAFLTMNHHVDLGVVLLPRNASTIGRLFVDEDEEEEEEDDDENDNLIPQFRFRGESYVPVPKEIIVPVPRSWRNKKLRLEIRARNETYFEFGAGLAATAAAEEEEAAGRDTNSAAEVVVVVGVSGNEVVSWGFTGTLLGVYCTNNGKGGKAPAYFSNWRYVPQGQFRG